MLRKRLCALDGLELGNAASLVVVNAYAEIDLVAARIFRIGLLQ